MLALRACLDDGKFALDGEVDGLMVADFEMQERMVLDAAPVAAVKAVGADKIDCAGDVAAIALTVFTP